MERAYVAFIFAVLAVDACGSGKVNGQHPPDASPGTTCGNGQIEPGELCEGSNLNGATCASLGFDSGTLSCAPSCKFDSSQCVGSLTLMVKPSRTDCTAPCAVFFDATGTTGLQDGDYVGANFNWDFDSMDVDPNGAHEQTIGFVTAHVFEIPGTYQVSVRVRDLAGRAGSTTVPITVSAMTGPTVYVSASGNDKNAGTIDQPIATVGAALSHAAPQVSILLRRGDTFNIGSNSVSFSTPKGGGPLLIGAYTDPGSPSTAAPIISSSAMASGFGTMGDIGGTSDLRLTDLHFVAANGAFQGIYIHSSASNTLIERVEMEGIGLPSSTGTVNFQIDNTANPLFFVDCHLHDFNGYGIYGDRSTNFALIGTTIEKFGGGDHGLRMQGGNDLNDPGSSNNSYVAENTIAPNTDSSASFDASAFRGDDTNIVEVYNNMKRVISFTPQNAQRLEHVSNVLVEGNLLSDNEPPDSGYTAISIVAQHVVVRNNVMVNPDVAVDIEGHPLLPANFVDDVSVYNNTEYFLPATGVGNSYQVYFARHRQTTGSLILQNNIFWEGMTNNRSQYLDVDKMGSETEDHNLMFAPNVKGTLTNAGTGAGDIVGDPQFVSTSLDDPNGFRLSAGSPAIDVGAMTPAYQDLSGVSRPAGAGWDLGAFERVPSAASPAPGSRRASAGFAAAIPPGSKALWGRRQVAQSPAASR